MKLRILIIVVVIITAAAAYLFFDRSNPVIYRYVDRASVQYSAFIIQNPFRDRAPERSAEIVLRRLQSGDCQQALLLPSLDLARVAHVCDLERKYHLESWSLMDRKGDGQKTQFIYETYRTNYVTNGLAPPVWVNVEKINGQWQATNYQTYY